MVGAIIVAVIGIVFITLGYLIWKKENKYTKKTAF